MASTEQVRNWYPEVVTNHASRGTPGYQPKCDLSKAVRQPFPKAGGSFSLWVHPKTVEAWNAYATVMTLHGVVVPSAGGTHNCRNIASTNKGSLHAYCVALDIPPNASKPAAFQADILKIKTKSGVAVFKNLASINDRMHDQIDCSPTDLSSGIDWSTVAGGSPIPAPTPGDEDVESLRLLVIEAAQKGWLPTQKDIDFWMGLTATPADPQWKSDFEPAWTKWKQQEWKDIVSTGDLTEEDVKAIVNGAQIVAP